MGEISSSAARTSADPRYSTPALTPVPLRTPGDGLRAWSWVPAPVLFVAIAGLAVVRPHGAYGSPALLSTLNFVLFGLASAFIASVVARSFLRRATPGLLALGAGVVAFGAASVVSPIASADPNVAVTIHNIGVLLAGACHVMAAVSTLRPAAPVRRPAVALATAYAGALAASLGIALLARHGALPTFFVQGHGGTPLRQVVLASAVASFAVASGVLLNGSGQVRSAFRHWYAVGLALVSVGLFGVLLQSSFSSELGWVGRGAQYLGSATMLLAAVAQVREARLGGAPLDALLRETEERRRAEQEAERQRAVITGIARIFEKALTCETEEDLGSACLEVAESVTQSRFGFLGEVNAAADRLVDIAISDPGWEACSMERSATGKRVATPFVIHGLYGRVLQDGKSLITNHPASHPDRVGTPPGHPPLTAFLGVPLLHAGRVWGMLGLGNREGGYGPDELASIEALAPAILQSFMRKRAEDELRRTDQRKTDFLAVLSHELRNPLAPIRNSVHILDQAPPGSPQGDRARAVIRRQTEHLTRLVDELLDVTRIERGKVELKRTRVDLREVARKTTDDLRSLFTESELTLWLECGPAPAWVDADATRLSQVVANLLQNAAKFTPRGGSVSISAGLRGGRAELSVRDSGVGMDAVELGRMFQPFAQADRTLARAKGGLGLGLALVKGLVELHGGSVVARSPGIGHGSEFVVSLPSCADGGPASAELGPSRAATPRRILIIEDHPDAGQSLADILRLDGHEVRLARDGRSGVSDALEFRPDVVLCDVGLPDLDGYQVARTLRSEASFRSCRLVALTGYAQRDDRERAWAAGFDHHLAKPPDLAELREVLTASPPAGGVAAVRGG